MAKENKKSNITKNNKKDFKTQFKEIFGNKKVLGGLFLTLFLIMFFHLGTMITMPGVILPDNPQFDNNSFVGMLNLLSGGGLSQVSIFAVGLGPFITAQIIIQLLSSDLIPPLSKLAKSGERGRKKLEIITRLITLPFCAIQAYAVLALILSSDSGITVFGHATIAEIPAGEIIALIALVTGGTYIAIFIGDMISKRGIGNGITLLILSGIVSSLFSNFNVAFNVISEDLKNTGDSAQLTTILSDILYVCFFIMVLFAVVFVNATTRKIPIQQTGQGLTEDKKSLPFLPIKLNSAGVIPVIFASSIMTIPGTIAQFLAEGEPKWFIMEWLTLNSWTGIFSYFILVILFSFFYSYVQINPSQIAENFEKGGKFIPGIRTGIDTEKHITKVLYRVNWIGAPFLATIAILPYILSLVTGIPSGMALGGTGVIIMVSGSIEFWNAIRSTSTTIGYNVVKQSIVDTHFLDEKNNDEKVTQLW